MKLPIVFDRKKGYFPSKMLYATHHLFSHYHARTKTYFHMWMAYWLADIVFWPARLWNRLTHHFYFGRLAFQYERGLADGRREVLNNFAAYADLSPEEIEAITSIPPHK